MKKFYMTLAVLVAGVGAAFSQCTIDNNNTALFNPDPDNVPCAEQGVAYDETLQFYIPVSQDITILTYTVTVYIDSVILNGVTGLPTGLNWVANPAGPLYMPNTNGCGRTQGTTSVAVGNYPISFDGRIYMSGTIPVLNQPFDTSFTIDETIQREYGKTFSIDVIAAGDACRGVGIKDFSSDLNAALNIYPNPSTGVFNFNLNAGRRVNGQIVVMDVTGKQVFNQNLDVVGLYSTTIDLTNMPKGVYTVQLRTAEGFAARTITIK